MAIRAARERGPRGHTLVELVIAIGATAAMMIAVGGLVRACLKAESTRGSRFALYARAAAAMESMVSGVKSSTFLYIPNNHRASRDVLAFSGISDADGDAHFGDALFPRIDEDVSSDMSGDSFPGLRGYDDDGDGAVDETGGASWPDAVRDDDEDGLSDEDPLDGLDNDGDGNIDEDLPSDAGGDLLPGVPSFDDDADGAADEGGAGASRDDDEDGSVDEDPASAVVYAWDAAGQRLLRVDPATGATGVLCDNVAAFSATYHPPRAGSDPYVTISMTLTASDGRTITLTEDVYPRNLTEKWGKRVR